jgi:hypothetical protein
MINRLLKLTAFLETPTGLALIVVPAFVVRLLLRAEISGAAITLGRGVVSAMVIYNLGVVLVLGAAGIQSPPVGILVWPVVILHAAMGALCVAALLRKPS